jgi:hypothetical protein
VHAHILRVELDYFISMMFAGGSKALRLPDSTLALYSFHQLTLQLTRMGDTCHSYSGLLTRDIVFAWRQHNKTPPNHMLTLSSPSGTLGMRVDTQSTKGAVVLTTLTVLPGTTME